MNHSGNSEVVIVGGVLAGGAAAAKLAQSGRRAAVRARNCAVKQDLRIILSAEHSIIRGIGIDLNALGGHEIARLRLVRGSSVAETTLPFRGLGLSRRVLDNVLLERASACGARVHRGHDLRVLKTESSVDVEVDNFGRWTPAALLLATGKHDVRNLRRTLVGPAKDLIGFKTYFKLDAAQTQALGDGVEVIVFRHGYAACSLSKVDCELCRDLTARSFCIARHMGRAGARSDAR